MGRIHVLPDAVINQIAAGEVVERPASVVKELVENAVDAGATQITVTLKDGGRELVSVLDNGSGMDEADARLAVARHATSKIARAEDLAGIQTLGFRGEALASIAAVSRFELATCADEAAGGVSLKLADGSPAGAPGGAPEAWTVTRLGFPRGTRVTCAELFYNTPARRKFLRSAPTEFQYTHALLAQLALAHPGVHFRIQHNGKPVASWPAAGTLSERVLQVLGPEVHEGMAEVRGAEGPLAFEGLVSLPSHGRSSRRWQHLFLNGRPIRNPGLNHAVYHAYRTLLMKDRHPAFVLKLKVHPAEADVNVHPAKTEVRLRNPQWAHTVLADKLHRALLEAGRRQALGEPAGSSGGVPGGEGARMVADSAGPAAGGPGGYPVNRGDPRGAGAFGRGALAADGREPVARQSHGDLPAASRQAHGDIAAASRHAHGDIPAASRQAHGGGWAAVAGAARAEERGEGDPAAFHFHGAGAPAHLTPGGAVPGAAVQGGAGAGAAGRADGLGHLPGLGAGQERLAMPLGVQVLSQLHTTYILAQRDGGLVVIDQHAAHERILFEQLRSQFLTGALRTERFLVPPTFELSPQNGVLLEQYLEQWRRLGFEIESFGRGGYLVREAPALLAGRDLKALVLEVLDELALFGKSGRLEEVVNEILERVACHGAIRAGMVLSPPEMEALVAQLEQLEINLYCPHGRPVWVEIGERELEKRFKRIV
jgi:DNA mismatch repair protein MutL